ncbi:lytic transglycosylase domain-containing protein [Desulfatitalea alkaliphila]|uniref:Transglycosylase SLT domain-containing protein n=1 Tax=Desulfatitalea alkaliphila TaxID=2929485 RepID=A0AA41R3V3_9BACT|nr:lytic transglycosylase domain-containing protein [Desulfatitalea alkaliphila]MCJ8501111.1 transglycosylase SLT domain-containing protein [Desulfatitalea alkaliphila]
MRKNTLSRFGPWIVVGLMIWGGSGAVAGAASLAAAVRPPADLTLCGEPVPWELADVRERFELEMLLSLDNRTQVVLWLKRAARYLPYITAELEKAGLPDDLKYLPIVESALRPHAGSRRGAMGYWQFMAGSGRNHGLTVDRFIDERRDLQASTAAALQYLQSLHEQFGSWTLALAAYNMGRNGLAAEMLEQESNNYYQLYLPLETQRFVFRMLAVKLIVGNPVAYGFDLAPEDLYPPRRFDTATIVLAREVPIRLVAEAAGTYFKRIKDLNPALRGHYLQEGRYDLHLPEGAADGFGERLRQVMAEDATKRPQRIYVVQPGDSLSVIAERFDLPLPALLIWNRIDLNKPIHPGDRLVLYPRWDDAGAAQWPADTFEEMED